MVVSDVSSSVHPKRMKQWFDFFPLTGTFFSGFSTAAQCLILKHVQVFFGLCCLV